MSLPDAKELDQVPFVEVSSPCDCSVRSQEGDLVQREGSQSPEMGVRDWGVLGDK